MTRYNPHPGEGIIHKAVNIRRRGSGSPVSGCLPHLTMQRGEKRREGRKSQRERRRRRQGRKKREEEEGERRGQSSSRLDICLFPER